MKHAARSVWHFPDCPHCLSAPYSLMQIVRDKECRLRLMIKMHGLSNGAYWAATVSWMALLYSLYAAVFLATGHALRLGIFARTDAGARVHSAAL
jgi:hypothetical protein